MLTHMYTSGWGREVTTTVTCPKSPKENYTRVKGLYLLPGFHTRSTIVLPIQSQKKTQTQHFSNLIHSRQTALNVIPNVLVRLTTQLRLPLECLRRIELVHHDLDKLNRLGRRERLVV